MFKLTVFKALPPGSGYLGKFEGLDATFEGNSAADVEQKAGVWLDDALTAVQGILAEPDSKPVL